MIIISQARESGGKSAGDQMFHTEENFWRHGHGLPNTDAGQPPENRPIVYISQSGIHSFGECTGL